MKKVMVSVALMLSAVMLTASMSASGGNSIGCACPTGTPSQSGFREDCCKYFDACFACEPKNVSCAGECDGEVIIKTCRTNAYANVRIIVDCDKKNPVVCEGPCRRPCRPRRQGTSTEALQETDDVDSTEVLQDTDSVDSTAVDSAAVDLTADGGKQNDPLCCTIGKLCCGKHTFLVEQDCPRCCKLLKVRIETPDKLKVNCCSTVCSREDGPTGSATVKATGGTKPYTFLIDGNVVDVEVDDPFFTFTRLDCTSGSRTLEVKDANQCTAETTVKIDCCKEQKCFEKKDHEHKKDHRFDKHKKDHRFDKHKKDCKDHKRSKHCKCLKCECVKCECPKKKVTKTKKGAFVAADHARKHKKNR